MNCPIVKTFIGKHIDLSKIVSISDAQVNHARAGVGFEIHVQLLDNPLSYVRPLDVDEYKPSGSSHYPYDFTYTEDGKILAEVRLQAQIDELVEQWRQIYGQ